jgi:hypothetical protein
VLSLQRELRTRLDAMRDPAQFADLLPALRTQEMATVERQLARLPALVGEAQALVRAERRAAEDGDGPMTLEDDPAPSCGEDDSTAASSAQRRATRAIAHDAAVMSAAQGEARRVRSLVIAQRDLHDGHAGDGGFPPRTTLYREADRYGRADRAWDAGAQAFRRAEIAFAAYDEAFARFGAVSGSFGDIEEQLAMEVRAHTWDALRHYREALAKFRDAHATYGAIRTASERSGMAGMWGAD